jgi:hypothetical protein
MLTIDVTSIQYLARASSSSPCLAYARRLHRDCVFAVTDPQQLCWQLLRRTGPTNNVFLIFGLILSRYKVVPGQSAAVHNGTAPTRRTMRATCHSRRTDIVARLAPIAM